MINKIMLDRYGAVPVLYCRLFPTPAPSEVKWMPVSCSVTEAWPSWDTVTRVADCRFFFPMYGLETKHSIFGSN